MEDNIDPKYKMNTQRDLKNSPMSQFIDPKKYPDFWEQMNNFKQFAEQVGQKAAEGNGVFASEEKNSERKKLSDECYQFNKESKRCYLCGCFMAVKWKFKESTCPANKW